MTSILSGFYIYSSFRFSASSPQSGTTPYLLKEQPYNTFLKTFSSHIDLTEDFVIRVAPYFKPLIIPAGEVIYRQGDKPEGLYLIESGVLRATYQFGPNIPDVVESCVAGTLSGELTALAGEPRNATVVAERQSVLWKLSNEDLLRLENDHPAEGRLFVKLVLKSTLSTLCDPLQMCSIPLLLQLLI